MSTRREFLVRAGLGAVAAGVARPTTAAGAPEESSSALPKLRPVSYRAVRLEDPFWAPRQRINRESTVPHLMKMMQEAGYVSNLERAAQGLEGGYRGPVYMDSDIFKSLEAASYVLALQPDAGLAATVDRLIADVRAAQQPDGYVDTYYLVNKKTRFTNLRDDHELYCAGHLIEAGVAHFEATGQRSLLDMAIRYADLIAKTFGDGKGQRPGYCGHPEIELALVRLWRATGDRTYFDLARQFLEHRGDGFLAREHAQAFGADFDGTYYQDHVRIRDHQVIAGHAVRALYLFSAAADIARETDDAGILRMMDRVWRNATDRRLFVTGGLGSSSLNEGFTNDYDLPTSSAYQESCASIGTVMWSHRLALLQGDGRYADLVERALYNAVAAGVAIEGTTFFYANPLASDGTQHRRRWYSTACCPPNLARTIAAVGGYAYATSDHDLYVNLYLRGRAEVDLAGGRSRVEVDSGYPWDGRVAITVKEAPAAGLGLRLRVPGWCRGPIGLRVNDIVVADTKPSRGYLIVAGQRRPGDRVELTLPMPVQRLEADPRVEETSGRVTLMRGPIVYCLEQCDQEAALATIALPPAASIEPVPGSDLLGATLLRTQAAAAEPEDPEGALYREAPFPRKTRPVRLTAVPYGAWDNRAAGPMKVWIGKAPSP
jgi:uncharacterized protein